jgi:hypothetical protein
LVLTSEIKKPIRIVELRQHLEATHRDSILRKGPATNRTRPKPSGHARLPFGKVVRTTKGSPDQWR